MLNNKKVYGIVPARGGSKGIPRKNLYRLGKDTLLERAIKLGIICPYVDHVIVSTDDQEMYEIARKYNTNSPSLRPAHLASDNAKTQDVILYLMNELQLKDVYIILLQPTSPLRTLDDINNIFRMFEENLDNADAIASVTKLDSPHPDKVQKIENGYLVSYIGVESMVPRQSLQKVYKLNGAFYLTHIDIIKNLHTFMPPRTLPYLMPPERSINLDNMLDAYFLEALIEKNLVKIENLNID